MTRELAKRRSRFWRWLRRFQTANPTLTLPALLGCAQDAGVCTREERLALLAAAGLR